MSQYALYLAEPDHGFSMAFQLIGFMRNKHCVNTTLADLLESMPVVLLIQLHVAGAWHFRKCMLIWLDDMPSF